MGPPGHQCLLLLLVVEHLVNLVGLDGLLPEYVARMVHFFIKSLGGMAIENRAAECHVLAGIAVSTKGHVPTRHDEFELFAPWFAEDGDALIFAPLFTTG